MTFKCRAIVLSAVFLVLVCAGSTPVFAEEEPLVPGPCLEKRAQIRKAIADAKKHRIGVKPYVEAAAAIEADVKAGKPESEIAPPVDRLKAALHSQFNNFRALKSGATGSVSSLDIKRMSQIRYLPESSMESIMFTLVNNERKAMRLNTLSSSGTLGSLAKGHSRDMVRRNFASHINPDGQDYSARALAAGIDLTKGKLFENFANIPCQGYAIRTVIKAHQALMDSPPHRATLLNPEIRCIGIGICYDKAYGIRVTQNFFSTSL